MHQFNRIRNKIFSERVGTSAATKLRVIYKKCVIYIYLVLYVMWNIV